jgi:flagellar biogenesis protein FliO
MLRVLLLIAALAAPGSAAAQAQLPSAPAPAAAPAAAPAPTPPVAAPPAAAKDPAKDPALYGSMDEPSPVDGPGYLLFKTLVVLGLVVAVIYLTLNVGARKLLKLGPQSNALVKVVDRVPLEPKKSLYVLQVGGEFLLVGASEQGLALVSKLDAEGVQKALAERIAAQPTPTFLERLNALTKPTPRKGS